MSSTAHAAATAGFTHCTSNAGIPELRELLAESSGRSTAWSSMQSGCRVAGCPLRAYFAIFQELLEPGDEILA
jgi:aspartate/methionine/tyrosine aminotransferase